MPPPSTPPQGGGERHGDVASGGQAVEAGPVGLGSAALAKELGPEKLMIIGVDSDQYLTATPEQPAKAGPSIADIAAGMYAYSGILNALLLRARTGRGTAMRRWTDRSVMAGHSAEARGLTLLA